MASRLKQVPESLLVRLWKERASREESLKAGNGRRIRVIYPGRVGTTAGPDFRDAVFEEEGVGLVRGTWRSTCNSETGMPTVTAMTLGTTG